MTNVKNAYDRTAAVFGPVIESLDVLAANYSGQAPLGTLGYPILDSVDGSGVTVGVLSTLFEWLALLQNILPDQAKGITCVVQNSCNQTFTMEINGPDVTMNGDGDLHDDSFDAYGITYALEEGLGDLAEKTLYKIGFDDQSPCQYTLTVYPSAATRAAYNSNVAKDVAIITGISFIFVIIVFLAYDFMQERRNKQIRRRAQEARAIVSSLFPANVRDRLFESNREKLRQKRKEKRKLKRKRKKKGKNKNKTTSDVEAPKQIATENAQSANDTNPDDAVLSQATVQQIINELGDKSVVESDNGLTPEGTNKRGSGVVAHPKHRLKTFLSNAQPPVPGVSEIGLIEGMGKPIADLFPHTTVLFADIVGTYFSRIWDVYFCRLFMRDSNSFYPCCLLHLGFTAWSSEREPEQVFALLQSLYQSFDKIAKKRGVFKVETIGKQQKRKSS